MVAASYPCDRTPHPTLKMKTPHNTPYSKDADLSYLRIVNARALVHIKYTYHARAHVVGRHSLRLQPGSRGNHSAFKTPRCVESSKTRASSSSKHHPVASFFQSASSDTGTGSSIV